MAQTSFSVTLPASLANAPLDGRLLLLLSTDDSAEPRFQISDGPETQIVIGKDVDKWMPGKQVPIGERGDASYPISDPAQLPPGKYHAQVLLHKYETFKRA